MSARPGANAPGRGGKGSLRSEDVAALVVQRQIEPFLLLILVDSRSR